MKIITYKQLEKLIQNLGLQSFLAQLSQYLKDDFQRWPDFTIPSRHTTHYAQGVIELMPAADNRYYGVKIVNGHPNNTRLGKQTVVALGLLYDVRTGYPLLFCDMTLLTALRTAATAGLATDCLAHKDAHHLAMIGTGAQSEFLTLAMLAVRPSINRISYFDIDIQAMTKYQRNLTNLSPQLIPCQSTSEAVQDAQIIVTAIAKKERLELFRPESVQPGTHINAIGGDCPGKTELSPTLVQQAKVIVELSEQTLIEGEVQNTGRENIHAELWEIIGGSKEGRSDDTEITLFDSVGCGLEDYSALRYLLDLTQAHPLGDELDVLPQPVDPKNLYKNLIPTN